MTVVQHIPIRQALTSAALSKKVRAFLEEERYIRIIYAHQHYYVQVRREMTYGSRGRHEWITIQGYDSIGLARLAVVPIGQTLELALREAREKNDDE